ncbi:hypothetical protein C8Q79DRAFT_1062187 [Trametes meyenii]|nr:hypothetical protein C8Q79DRAFT_1062187 [Trametes meyenii]
MDRESSQPDRKRPRLSTEDEDGHADVKPFANHPTLHFDDGNVVLRAGRTLFCVHRSVLSKHSTVFRDLFEQPHERFRGLMHVAMEETAEEIEALLDVVYDGLRVDIEEFTVETFPTIANVLRMATKYRIERPREDIVARIRAEWPSTLAQHDAKETRVRAHLAKIYRDAETAPGARQGQNPDASPEDDIIVHPAAVIALLRSCGYHDRDLLFPLFYALSRTTWQFGGRTLGHHLAPLAQADVERFVVGLEQLREAHISFAMVVPEFAPPPTNPPHFCVPGATRLWQTIMLRMMPGLHGVQRTREPLEQWRDVVPLVGPSSQQNGVPICNLCAQSVVNRIQGFRQYLWAELPVFFQLT